MRNLLHITSALVFACLVGATPAAASELQLGDEALHTDELSDLRARGNDPMAEFSARMDDNSLQITGGASSISVLDSFDNAQGVFTVLQNTGSQVILQNATIVNINLH
jgi:hypothetical protein